MEARGTYGGYTARPRHCAGLGEDPKMPTVTVKLDIAFIELWDLTPRRDGETNKQANKQMNRTNRECNEGI
jgi:hypothetical protein